MSLATGVSEKNDSKKSWLLLSWGVRFTIAIAGAAVFFWMASRYDAHKLPALPTFHERFWLVAPIVLEWTAGFLLSNWAVFLFRGFNAFSKRKRWTSTKMLAFAAWILTAIPCLGADYMKYLWPSYHPQPWMFRAEFSINFLLLVIFLSAGKNVGGDEQVKPRPEWWITAWIWLTGAIILLVMILPLSLNVIIALLLAPFMILILAVLVITTSGMRYLARSGQGLGAIAMRVQKGQPPLKKQDED
jgi:hypothetical protein